MDLSLLDTICINEPPFRKKQIFRAIFHDLISDWDSATTLPSSLRARLSNELPLTIDHTLFVSKDNQSSKALIMLQDGSKIEAVLMRHHDRNTICVSTQVGCPMGCAFCATGKLGFTRNLTSSEIVIQVLLFARFLNNEGNRVTNIVFMGMGEPFLNYDAVISAIKLMNQPDTFNLGARRFSISTAGLTDGIEKLSNEKMEINLAISLHASNDKLRSQLMPINRRYPLSKLLGAVKEYIKKTNRKVMFEYLLLDGINDSEDNAAELAQLLSGLLCTVNLIPYNATGVFKRSNNQAVKNFKTILESHRISAVQRYAFGEDINAACGQLAAKALPDSSLH